MSLTNNNYSWRFLHPEIIQFVYEELKQSVFQEVSKDGLSLGVQTDNWRADPDVVIAAIAQNPLSFRYAAEDLRANKEIALLAVKGNGVNRFWAGGNLKEDAEICQIAEYTLPKKFSPSYSNNQDSRIFSATYEHFPFFENFEGIKNISNIFNERISVPLEKPECSFFIRDAHVTRFQGGHLLPYSIKNPSYLSVLMSMLPDSADHFLINEQTGELSKKDALSGKGSDSINVDQAIITAYDYGIPFKRGKTCIEGGNCFLFMSNGQRRAIIGELTVYLSLLALEEQGYFRGIILEEAIDPSLEAYRIVRNLKLFQEYTQLKTTSFTQDEEKIELEYRKKFITPISVSDRIKAFEEAQSIEVKLRLTRERIAKELGIPLEQIAFIPQTNFHIDMEMFVTPEGTVALQDEKEVLSFLKNSESQTTWDEDEKKLYEKYRETATENELLHRKTREKQRRILQELGVDIHPLPLIFEASDNDSCLNYCNGIFVQKAVETVAYFSNGQEIPYKIKENGYDYVTTGITYDDETLLHVQICKELENNFPGFSQKGIKIKGVPKTSEIVSRGFGGVRCLTFENSLPI